jgi:asparagine synthetase B (glutamine-hydrolysing)
LRSVSYAVRAPSFEQERGYVAQAVSLLQTDHLVVEISEKDFPDLLLQATRILAQPVLTSAEVCKLGLARQLASLPDRPHILFGGLGADGLFGLEPTLKVSLLEALKKVPASALMLAAAGRVLRPVTRRGQTLLNFADIVAHRGAPDYFADPIDTDGSIGDFTLARRCFGDQAVKRALDARRDRAATYLDLRTDVEKLHVIELLGDGAEVESQSSQLYLAHGLYPIYPFLDEDLVRLSFAFTVKVRYIRGRRQKYLLKTLLEQRTRSTVARQPKGGSMFHPDLERWMKDGLLRDLIQSIDLPAYLTRADFERLAEHPRLPQSLALWHMLAFDLFQKQVAQPRATVAPA